MHNKKKIILLVVLTSMQCKDYSGALELTIESYKIPNPREGFGERGDNRLSPLNGALSEVKHLLHSPKHLPGLGDGSGRG